ncbi:MAG: MBL fold metallo-hydrolase [Thiohalocapsa sp.]
MRFAVLGSGSRGNATLIESGETRILVDCGFRLKELERRLAVLDTRADSIAAVVVTHEHGDHIAGVARLAARHRIEVWSSPGTWRAAGCPQVERLRLFTGHGRGFRIGDLHLRPIPVPHDAREPCQFVIDGDGRRLGILTDAGTVTPKMCEALQDCDAFMLEANHDPQMLRSGPYPRSLQQRVGGPFGHLSNQQAAQLLQAVRHERLKLVLLSHISEQNNRPDLAIAAVSGVDGGVSASVRVAEQDQVVGWLAL